MVQVVTHTIPTSRLHTFDVTLDKVLIEYNVIEQEHYTPRTGAEKQTILLRGAHTPDAAGRIVYWSGRMAKGYFDNSMRVERHYSLFGRVVLSFLGVDAHFIENLQNLQKLQILHALHHSRGRGSPNSPK